MRKTGLVVLTLALGVFGIITTEMGVVGILPRISEELGVAPSTAGWLVGVFALVVATTGPFMTLLASRIPRKTVLATSLAVFALSNAVYALTDRFEVMFLFRVVPAVFHPVFFSVALTAAARLVPAQRATRAATTVFAGVTVGFAFGVPLTSYLAEHLSLAAAFWFGAGVNLLALLGVLALFPSMPSEERLSYGSQLRILRRPRLWLAVLAVVSVFAAMFSVYGYFAEYLEQVTRLNGSQVGAALMAFGIVMVAGNLLFGRLLERAPIRTVTAFPVLYVIVYAVVYAVGPWTVPMALGVLLWGRCTRAGWSSPRAGWPGTPRTPPSSATASSSPSPTSASPSAARRAGSWCPHSARTGCPGPGLHSPWPHWPPSCSGGASGPPPRRSDRRRRPRPPPAGRPPPPPPPLPATDGR